jgi:hypothetical protein
MTKNTGKKPDLLGSANYVDPVRKLTVYSRRTLGNHKRCWYCGAWCETEGDHFYPKSMGGVLKVRCCVPCNREKADRTPLEWVAYLDELIERCMRNLAGKSRTGCQHGEFIRGRCELDCPELTKLRRMRQATITLWQRVKPH